MLAKRWQSFQETIFSTMTALANECGAVNLSQGYPDFDGPDWIKEAATKAMQEGHNQYAPSMGIPELRRAIARSLERDWKLSYDPDEEITVFSGATEAIFVSLQALVNEGDEVITFAPFYDSYPPSTAIAGGILRTASLPFPDFRMDIRAVEELVTPKTKLLILNTPHNPSGKVFKEAELKQLAELCVRHDLLAITDEVYEHIVFGPSFHASLASQPGMKERTVRISSLGKTFSLTGWKIGWASAPPELTKAIRVPHQFTTFATSTPFQHAAVEALDRAPEYYPELIREYNDRRDILLPALVETGFRAAMPEGTYFIICDHSAFGYKDDVEFCRYLTRDIGVAAIPPSYFFPGRKEGKNLVRFSFAKKVETLEEAANRLEKLDRG